MTCNRRIGSNEPEIDGYQEPRRSIDSGEPVFTRYRQPRRGETGEPRVEDPAIAGSGTLGIGKVPSEP